VSEKFISAPETWSPVRPWPFWLPGVFAVGIQGAGFVAGLLVGLGIAAGVLPPGIVWNIDVALLQVALLLLAAWYLARFDRRRLPGVLRLNRVNWRGVGAAAALWLPLAATMAQIEWGWRFLARYCGFEFGVPPNQVLARSSWEGLALLAVLALGVAPVMEEILYRGWLFDSIRLSGRVRTAWWLSAVLFAGVHCSAAQFPSLVVFALVLQCLRWRYRSLWPAIALHFLNNAGGIVALTLIRLYFPGLLQGGG